MNAPPRLRPELHAWPPEVEALARYLRNLDLQAELTCNPARREILRQQANQVAARLEALKQTVMATEAAA